MNTVTPQKQPVSPATIVALASVAVWGTMLYGVLQIHHYPEIGERIGHNICGPWGCAARPEALLGYHLFWLVLLAPIGLALGIRLEAAFGRALGGIVFGIGAGLVLVIAGWAIFDCLVNGPDRLKPYWGQIALFKLVTNTDIPVAQLAATGLACWIGSFYRRLLGTTASNHPDPVEQSPASVGEIQGTP